MTIQTAAQAESEVERLRIELAILRAAKVRDDLTRLVHHNPLETITINELDHLDTRLHSVEVDARELVHNLSERKEKPCAKEKAAPMLVLKNPLPADGHKFTIERVAKKFAATKGGPNLA